MKLLYNKINSLNVYRGVMQVRKTIRFFTLFIAFGFIFALNSCYAGRTANDLSRADSRTGQENTVLRFISSWGGVDSKAETLKTVLDKFAKANPQIEVVNESLFGEDFLPKIKTDFASGNNPDVFGLWPGSDINYLIKAGKVADLTGILNSDKEWKAGFDKKMWAYTTYNGKIYGLPEEIIFECLFINTDLFEKYNVRIPHNFSDLKTAVEIFKNNGIIPIAFNTQAEGTFLYQNIVAMLGGREDTEKPFTGGSVKKCYIDAMKYIKELYDMDAFPPDCFTITNNERNILFREKKAAMIVQGSWFIGDFSPDDRTVDIIPLPCLPEDKPARTTFIYGLGGGSFHLSSTAAGDEQKLSASVKLLKALTSDETASVFASETGMISNIEIGKYNINYRTMTLKGLNMLSKADILIGPPDSFVDRSSWEADIALQFPYYLEGRISAEDLWKNAISNGIMPD